MKKIVEIRKGYRDEIEYSTEFLKKHLGDCLITKDTDGKDTWYCLDYVNPNQRRKVLIATGVASSFKKTYLKELAKSFIDGKLK